MFLHKPRRRCNINAKDDLIKERFALNILGIETSCDDTCAAVVKNGRDILSSCTVTSADEQNKFGGIVPEIASRRHIEHISSVAQNALDNANLTMDDIHAIAVTFAPGLIGALLVGVNFAKGLAYAQNKPLIPVHHLRGHIASLYITHKNLTPPFLTLVASGGHSHIIHVTDYTKFKVYGRTLDDAAGEAFDKVARILNLGYPGGPAVSKAAKSGNQNAYKLPIPNASKEYDVSFSGLKTAVLNTVNKLNMQGENVNVNDMCASFEYRIASILSQKLLLCAKNNNINKICLAGGVAANGLLRQLLSEGTHETGAKLYMPDLSLCTDNAAMIAAQGYYEYKNGNIAQNTLNGLPTLEIDYM